MTERPVPLMRVTPQTRAILRLLADEDEPLTASQICEITKICRATVYATLRRLTDNGWVTALPAVISRGLRGGGTRYKLAINAVHATAELLEQRT